MMTAMVLAAGAFALMVTIGTSRTFRLQPFASKPREAKWRTGAMTCNGIVCQYDTEMNTARNEPGR